MKRKPLYYNVAPRYTPGSPALVRQEIAEQVAAEEARAIEYYLKGYMGEESRAIAERLGLAGIVELRHEMRKGWDVIDLCTGTRHFRPFPKVKR